MIRKKISVNDIIKTLGNLAIAVHGPIDGVFIDNLADLKHVTPTTLDWVGFQKENQQQLVEQSLAHVIIAGLDVNYSENLQEQNKTLIVVENPKKALAIIGNCYFVKREHPGIHPTAIIDPDAIIGNNVHVGPYAVIGKASIGDGTVVSPFVRIYDDVTIGRCCFIKEGAVIGGAGFGFERDEDGNRFRFPQIGGVRIGDHVDIGGNTCIDRGALSDTILEDYAKVDNLCHIAHNVHIGRNAVVVACAEVSGSCSIGEESWVGPNACIRDQRSVGCNTMIGMGAVVVKHVGDNEVWAGNPAREMTKK